jgi:hypothetical protein
MAAAIHSGEAYSKAKRLEQVDRIAGSTVLNGSEALCHLLRYLAKHSLESPETILKEHQIATEVFGRPARFDPRLDSTVRVQLSRLRAKLTEYYSGPGRDDLIMVLLPKGAHRVTFQNRELLPQPETVLAPPTVPPEPTAVQPPSRWWLVLPVPALLLVATTWFVRPGAQNPTVPLARTNGPLAVFWHGALESSQEPLVVFSNAEFVGRPETGLRYFNPQRDSAERVFDHYTGVGEVISIHELDQLFNKLGRPIQLKRGMLLNWDDAKNRDLIFLGSPSENLSLREMPLDRDFKFETTNQPPRKGDLGIVNLHPAPGEEAVFFGSRDLPITEDYAVVELARGTQSAQSVLLLAGTTTFGTQGAVEFVCNQDRIRDLLTRLGVKGDSLPPFSAVLRVKVNRGVPTESSIAALRHAGS